MSYTSNSKSIREATNKILEMVDEGALGPKDALLMCLNWMSEDEVAEMAQANDLFYDEEED